ncbi:MAG: exosortase/archaeosortase family protein [Planctomycetia bacterium]|nr:exosortase/archaeosortase family protein [Planctomycetia bacterium]
MSQESRNPLESAAPVSPGPDVASGRSAATAGSRIPTGPAISARTSADFNDEGLLEGWRSRLAALWGDLHRPDQGGPLAAFAAFAALLVYGYWPGLLNAKASWSNAQYSHGWIVPLFSVGILLWWRKPLSPVSTSARLAGLCLLLAGFGVRLLAAWFRIVTIDMYTFVPAVGGAFLLCCGWSGMRWAWAPIAFLIFMFPLPDEATRYLLGPLQTLATTVSTFALQTFGLEAYQEGNQIVIGEMHLGVVDACSGLRMLTIFIALSVALVMLGERPWWENAVIIGSAIPIALIVNSIRITVTGMLYQIATSEVAEMVFHDLAGWIMMPMALAMLYGEQFLLSHLMLAEDDDVGGIGFERHLAMGGGRTARVSPVPLAGAVPGGATERVKAASRTAGGRDRRGESTGSQGPLAAGPKASGKSAFPRSASDSARGSPDGLLPGI